MKDEWIFDLVWIAAMLAMPLSMVLAPLFERLNPDPEPEPRERPLATPYRGWSIAWLRPGFVATKPSGVRGVDTTIDAPTLHHLFRAIDAAEEFAQQRGAPQG